MASVQDSSSDVNEFLLRIRELEEKTDREDEQRAKQLEQEILEGRKRRQALRAQRSRSSSPAKDASINFTPAKEPDSLADKSEKNPTEVLSKEEQLRKTIVDLVGPSATLQLFPGTQTKLTDSTKLTSHPPILTKLDINHPKVVSLEEIQSVKPPKPPAPAKPLKLTPERASKTEHKAPHPTFKASSFKPSPSSFTIKPSESSSGLKKFDPGINNNNHDELESLSHGRVPLPGMSQPNSRPTTPIAGSLSRPSSTAPSTRFSSGMTTPLGTNWLSSPDRLASSPKERSSTSETAALLPANLVISPPLKEQTPSPSFTRSKSPVRGGFVQSAMLKREQTIHLPLSRDRSPVRSGSSTPEPKSTPVLDNLESPTIFLPRAVAIGSTNVTPTSSVSSVHSLTTSTGLSNETPDLSHSDSRRWSPARQTWLESALKKNQAPSPDTRNAARTPSPTRSSRSFPSPDPLMALAYSPSIRRGRSPPPLIASKPNTLKATFDVAKDVKNSEIPDKSIITAQSVPVKPKPFPPKPDHLVSTPSPLSLSKTNTFKPAPPKQNLVEKPSPEAIEKLRHLRSGVSPTRQSFKSDQEKEHLAQLKSSLRRSNTVKYQAPDQVKETLLGAKGSLKPTSKSSSPIREIPEERPALPARRSPINKDEGQAPKLPSRKVDVEFKPKLPLRKSSSKSSTEFENKPKIPIRKHSSNDDLKPKLPARKSSVVFSSEPLKQPSTEPSDDSFTNNLSTMLSKGRLVRTESEHLSSSPRASGGGIRKVKTFDSAELSVSKPRELQHINKGRSKGPKRRLPTNVKTQQTSRSVTPQQVLDSDTLKISKTRESQPVKPKQKPIIPSSSRSVSQRLESNI